ncbi:hypothetical protein EP7_005239 [Isosphaeraceae bacterium EP7]
MIGPESVYATDEDVAVRAAADFMLLCPHDQVVVQGSDGVLGPADRWLLRSGTVDFTARGVVAGQVVRLLRPVTAFRPPGESLAVDRAVAGSGVLLRRLGQGSGAGQTPGPDAGVTGVEFRIVTLAPQIAAATSDLNRRLGVDPSLAGRRPGDLSDPRELRDAVVLTVLYRRYLDLARGDGRSEGTFVAKASLFKAELDELLARLIVHWKPADPSGWSVPASRFSTRISR